MKSLHITLVLAVLLVPSICRATYDPTVGRWMSRDPIGEGASLNLYSYVHNDSIDRIDPLGLDDVTFVQPNNPTNASIVNSSHYFQDPPNQFSIIAHSLLSNPNLIVGPDGKIWNVDDLANFLKDPKNGYKPGMTIILHVCNSGVSQNGNPSLAQQLANLMKTQVSGATNETEPSYARTQTWWQYLTGSGTTPIPNSGHYTVDNNGTYVPFQPKY